MLFSEPYMHLYLMSSHYTQFALTQLWQYRIALSMLIRNFGFSGLLAAMQIPFQQTRRFLNYSLLLGFSQLPSEKIKQK